MTLAWPSGIHITEQKFIPIYPGETLLRTASGKAQPSLPQDPVLRARVTFGPSHNDAASTLMDAMYGISITVMMPILKRLKPADGLWPVIGEGFIGTDERYYIDYVQLAGEDPPEANQMIALGSDTTRLDIYRITEVVPPRLFLAPKRRARISPPTHFSPAESIVLRKLPGQDSWGARTADWNQGFTVMFEEAL